MGTVSVSQGKESSGDWLHDSVHVVQLSYTLKTVWDGKFLIFLAQFKILPIDSTDEPTYRAAMKMQT